MKDIKLVPLIEASNLPEKLQDDFETSEIYFHDNDVIFYLDWEGFYA